MTPIDRIASGLELRGLARSGAFTEQTAGQAPDYLQGNVVILPVAVAGDFLHFCLNNPKPCPLIGVSHPGERALRALGEDIDIAQDIPRYRVYQQGELVSEPASVSELWRHDLVTFVLGCSFTFEEALIREGHRIRHIDQGRNVPMFRSSLQTLPAGQFSGPVVVTMRPFKAHDIPAVFDICARYPHAHGAPLAWGDPASIGIADLSRPDYGDPVDLEPDDVPVYWACGVTPQAAITAAKPSLCITHAPGYMLVTDIPSRTAPDVSLSMSRFTSAA